MRVLGIDPSLCSTGFGIVEDTGGPARPIAFGIIKTSPKQSLDHRLLEIEREIERLVRSFGPEEASIENPFYSRNVKTALILGQVRGAVLVGLASRKCRVNEYSPMEIKKSVTGYGQADKDQVQRMVKALLGLADDPMPDDASDALAAAICHLNQRVMRAAVDEGR